MNTQRYSTEADEIFFASPSSPLVKTRLYIWVGLLAGLMLSILREGKLSGAVFFSGGIALLLGLAVHWLVQRQLGAGKALIRLTADALEAPNLSGPRKRLRWAMIASVSLDTVKGGRWLTFQLHPLRGMRDRRSFWTGRNEGRPALNLAAFSTDVQEQLVDAIERRRRAAAGDDAAPVELPNELREEREFRERLKALQPIPWTTIALITINALVWLFTLTQGAAPTGAPAENLLLWGGNAASEVQKGEWWRMLSATFLHSNALHVTMNMLGLYAAGVMVERIYGPRLYLLVYIGSALVGSALSLHYAAQKVVSVGASGAVFGLSGALLIAILQHRSRMPKALGKSMTSGLAFFILYSLLHGFRSHGIDNAAHLGGLIAGCVAALILPERLDILHFRRTFARRAVLATVMMTAATVGIAAMAPRATVDQRRVVENGALIRNALKHFDEQIRNLQDEIKDVQAGKLSDLEADERSRSIYAPAFRGVALEFSRLELNPADPRTPLIENARRISELLTESLAMDSVPNPDTGKLEPADRRRAEEIEAEIRAADERMKKIIAGAGKR